jgi:hypothetical protein
MPIVIARQMATYVVAKIIILELNRGPETAFWGNIGKPAMAVAKSPSHQHPVVGCEAGPTWARRNGRIAIATRSPLQICRRNRNSSLAFLGNQSDESSCAN